MQNTTKNNPPNEQVDILEILAAAQSFIDEGWNIFPCKENGKEPRADAIKGGSQNTTLKDPLTAEYFENIDGAYNIAAHTGSPSGFAVIDIDVAKTDAERKKGKRSAEEAEILKDKLVALFGETRVHKTRSGGFHLFYKYGEELASVGRKIDAFKKNPTVSFGEDESQVTLDLSNIDILAGNGYILLPPSVVEGAEYSVIAEDPMGGLPDFPVELLNEIFSNGKRGGAERAYIDIRNGGELDKVPENSKSEQRRINLWNNDGEKKLNAKLTQYRAASSGERHDSLMKACATVFSVLPFSEWDKAPRYINSVISTFNPPYNITNANDTDAREVRNAHAWTKAQEWYSRVRESKKDEEERRAEIARGSEELGVDEDSYAEQLDAAIAALQTDDKGNPIANTYNIAQLFRLHPLFAGRIRYDIFTEKLTYKGNVSKVNGVHEIADEKKNSALVHLLMEVQRIQFPKAARADVFSGAVSVGMENQYDSYVEFMDNLVGKWDGEERLEHWLHKVYKVPNDLYHRSVSAQFVFAMVRRAYEPGANFPYVLWLDGEQGVGKSYACKILASDKWYLEYTDTIDGREINLQMTGKTLIDLAEGESVSRASQKRVKALISDQKGIHRTFGSAEVREHPIRHVWTLTNNDGKLIDDTGNRRYLPVKIYLERYTVGDMAWLRAYRTQIFAEAVHKYHEMKAIEKKINAEIKILEESDDADSGDMLYALYEKQKNIHLIERKLSEMGIDEDDAFDKKTVKVFRAEYGIPYIPENIAEKYRSSAQLKTPLDEAIHAVLYSYDEYRARVPEFSIGAQEIFDQIPSEVRRTTRLGQYSFSEIGRRLKIIDPAFEQHRERADDGKNRRIVKFKYTPKDAYKKLDAIKRLRENGQGQSSPPSSFASKSVDVTLEQKAAKIRFHREDEEYLVIDDRDIMEEMRNPNSVVLNNW